MSTLAVLKATIADDLDRSDKTSQIASAISEAIKFFRHQPFWWTKSRSLTFATVADQSVYDSTDHADIPNIIAIDAMFVLLSDNQLQMSWVRWPDWEEATDNNATSGQPWSFAYEAEKIYLYPIPNDAYTIRLHGWIQHAEPASDDEAGNRWMTDGYDLIRAEAKRRLFAHVLRDYEMARIMEREAGIELRRLMAEAHLKTDRNGVICGTDF